MNLPLILATCLTTLAAAFGAAAAPTDEAISRVPSLSEAQRRLNLEAFDAVWETVRDTHWDPEAVGESWLSARDALRPRVASASSMTEARRVLQDLVDRLGQSHFAILSADLYGDLAPEAGGGDGTTGIDIRILEQRATVVSVAPGSPADRAGVRPGWIVHSAGGRELAPIIERASSGEEGPATHPLLLTMALRLRLQGEVGSTTRPVLVDGKDRRLELELELDEPRGARVQLGYLPPMHVWFEHRKATEGVGLIAFNAFLDPGALMPRFGEAMRSSMQADGLVIDLRGNPGGIGAMAMGMAGWLVERSGQRLGSMTTREGTLDFAVFPRPETYGGPLAILVDDLTASTAEILAGGLQDLGRARVFGTPTAGMALPSRVELLPNGDAFQYAFASYVSALGRPLEGRGVVPDEVVAPTRARLLEGADPALEAALTWIRKHEAASDRQGVAQ